MRMTDETEDEVRTTRKSLEEKANNAIEKLQEMRTTVSDDMHNCKSFLLNQINSFFEEMEERKRKTESESDEAVKSSLMELMGVLERIDCLIGEIDTCKRTVTKLNNLLLRESKDEWKGSMEN
ncbi:hypothetical protein D915_010557 [Fasciola hepatica]|uniref:Uncharacterized protein n=1 Tax=Fasciola hepatica TaxID=6192 RepID=A0A2H1BSY1_FASHE|nr:hypothetical protein D915_010557 [Fasciola hepatica]